MTREQREAYDAYVEAQSSTRLETWVTSNLEHPASV